MRDRKWTNACSVAFNFCHSFQMDDFDAFLFPIWHQSHFFLVVGYPRFKRWDYYNTMWWRKHHWEHALAFVSCLKLLNFRHLCSFIGCMAITIHIYFRKGSSARSSDQEARTLEVEVCIMLQVAYSKVTDRHICNPCTNTLLLSVCVHTLTTSMFFCLL